MKYLVIVLMILTILFSTAGCILPTTTTVDTGVVASTTTTTPAILPDRIIAGRLTDIDTIAGNKYTTLYFDDGLSVEVTTTSLTNFSDEFYQFFESSGTFTYDLQHDSQNANLYDLIGVTPSINTNSLNTK